MAVRKGSGARLFLLEMMVAIVFFSFSSAICVSLFVRARLLSQDNEDRTAALRLAQDAAECYKAEQGQFSSFEDFFPQGELAGGSFAVYFDSQWQPCTGDEARYRLILETERSGKLHEGTVAVERLPRPMELIRLEVCSYEG